MGLFDFGAYQDAGHHEPMDMIEGMSTRVLNDSEKIPYPMSDEQVYKFALDMRVSECCATANVAILKASVQSKRKGR